MAKASPAFTNFTAGELSPRLDGRTDLYKIQNGCKTLQTLLCIRTAAQAAGRAQPLFARSRTAHIM